MSTPFDEALAQLGLRTDADARNVRRAYAQQLKQLDPATQPREFQALREAYEFALHVINMREAEAAKLTPAVEPLPIQPAEPKAESLHATVPPPAPAEVTLQQRGSAAAVNYLLPDSADAAKSVFLIFASRASAGFKSEADATAALEEALADDRLLNLEARTLFELQVAHLIMGGWQPGHEFLLGPASKLFSWETDRAHLRVFGHLGAALDTAINEWLIFLDHSQGNLDRLEAILSCLRGKVRSIHSWSTDDLQLVQVLVQRYPNWLPLATSRDHINSLFEQIGSGTSGSQTAPEGNANGTARLAQATVVPDTSLKALATALLVIFGVLVAVFFVFGVFSGSGSSAPSSSPPYTTVETSHPPKDLGASTAEVIPAKPNFVPYTLDTIRPAPEARASLGGVEFIRRDGDLVVGAMPRRALSGESPLWTGDIVFGCKPDDEYTPLRMLVEAGRCGITKSVDPKSGATSYSFKVMRGDWVGRATLLVPNNASSDQPRQVEQARQPAQEPAAQKVQLGNVTFALARGRVIVHEVGSYGDTTLQVGDRLMRCLVGNFQKPLELPQEALNCTASTASSQGLSPATYKFRVWRNGDAVAASLTIPLPSAIPDPTP